MDPRSKDSLQGWFAEVGVLYVVVIVVVGGFFLLKEGAALFSCNPTLGRGSAEPWPGYYGRSP
jgi:hypothetical protein